MNAIKEVTLIAIIICLFLAANVHAETPERTLQWRTESDGVFLYARGETNIQCPSGRVWLVFFDSDEKLVMQMSRQLLFGTFEAILGGASTTDENRYQSLRIKCV